jgi:hypothetical protein
LYFYGLDHRDDQGDEMKIVHSAALAAFLLLGGSAANAGGDIGGYASHGSSYCRFVEDAQELINYSSDRDLKAEVHTRYEHAAEVSKSRRAIFSASPLFIWANQAKISCAKSYGYLRMARRWRKRPDYVMLQKCECFYQRMTAYLGH